MLVWVEFVRHLQLLVRAAGHEVKRIRIDRAPELTNGDFTSIVEQRFGILVEFTPREHHKGIGRAERSHDVLTRSAKAMLRKAGLDTPFLLAAREHANWLENRVVHNERLPTKFQRFHGKVPLDFERMTPLVFGTTVAVVEDVRGPKGSLARPRASIDRFIGIRGNSYIVYRAQGRSTVFQHRVRALNEEALARSGLPPGVSTFDRGTQTIIGAMPPAATQRTAPARASTPPTVNVAIGTRLDVFWRSKRNNPLPDAWYTGKVIDVETMADGRRRHFVRYDGEVDARVHDLASPAFEWQVLKEARRPTPPRARHTRSRAEPIAQSSKPHEDS